MSDALPVIESHLAAGDGWRLSRGREAASGAPRLVVTLAGADLRAVRDWLAVAGSQAGRHLAEVIDAVAQRDGAVAVVFAAPAGPSLAEVLRRRGSLSAGEIVTLVAPIAATLGKPGPRGLSAADVSAETLWLDADGRPVLVPVVGARDDGLAALARLARARLDLSSPGAAAVASTLDAALAGDVEGERLAESLLRTAPASPISVASGEPQVRAHRARRTRRARPPAGRTRPAIAIVFVALVAVGLGGTWGRHDGGGAVLAAPPALAPSALSPAAPSPSWRAVMTHLEQSRARAYATGNVALLDTVYAAGSPTGASDRVLLTRMVAKGQRAVGLRAFVQSADVVAVSNPRATLTVTDALTSYDVIGRAGRVMRRGHGRPAREWQVVLVQGTTGWRIWSVAVSR